MPLRLTRTYELGDTISEKTEKCFAAFCSDRSVEVLALVIGEQCCASALALDGPTHVETTGSSGVRIGRTTASRGRIMPTRRRRPGVSR